MQPLPRSYTLRDTSRLVPLLAARNPHSTSGSLRGFSSLPSPSGWECPGQSSLACTEERFLIKVKMFLSSHQDQGEHVVSCFLCCPGWQSDRTQDDYSRSLVQVAAEGEDGRAAGWAQGTSCSWFLSGRKGCPSPDSFGPEQGLWERQTLKGSVSNMEMLPVRSLPALQLTLPLCWARTGSSLQEDKFTSRAGLSWNQLNNPSWPQNRVGRTEESCHSQLYVPKEQESSTPHLCNSRDRLRHKYGISAAQLQASALPSFSKKRNFAFLLHFTFCYFNFDQGTSVLKHLHSLFCSETQGKLQG